jgi:putative ABC transport system permease protein
MVSLLSDTMQWRIAFRNVFRHYSRSAATLSAIAFGCFSVMFAGGYFEDIFRKMRESFINSHVGHIQVYKEGYLDNETTAPLDYMIDDPEDIKIQIAGIPDFYAVSERIQFAGLVSSGDNSSGVLIQAIDPDIEKVVLKEEYAEKKLRKVHDRDMGWMVLTKGRHLSAQSGFEALVGQGLATSLGISIGDTIVLMTNTVDGGINAIDVEVVGEYYTSTKDLDDRSLRISISTGKTLLATESVQSLVVFLNSTRSTTQAVSALNELIGTKGLPYEIKTWDQLADYYTKTRTLFGFFFSVIMVIIGVIITLSIFNTMSMAVMERTVEIGTIRALGASEQSVVALFLKEGLIIGFIGGFLGIILGSVLVHIIALIGVPMPPPPGATMDWIAEPALIPRNMLLVFILSVVTSVIAAIFPAKKAAKMQIAQALRHVL